MNHSSASHPAPGHGSAPLIELRAASVNLGATAALIGIDLTVAEAAGAPEPIAIVGPSGAGKTTLLRLLAGAVAPSSGTASVLGEALAGASGASLRALRARIGFIHQSPTLVPMLRVVQNVAAGQLGSHGLLGGLRSVLFPSAADTEAIHALLNRVGIGDKLYQRVDRLSGGEQQRAAIARTLHQAPGLILADEPVASVDPARARAVVELLVSLAAERRVPLIASLHDVDLAEAFFPRIVGLRGGRIAFDSADFASDDRKGELREHVAELYRIEGGE